MVNFHTIYWTIIVGTLVLSTNNISTATKLYVFDEFYPHKVSLLHRERRQTHPAATIAKLSPQDNSAFIPIIGPNQQQSPQQTPFSQPNDFFPGNDFPSLQNVPNTLVDYLVPPSPDSPTTNLNFQDPAANLHNLQNNIDNFELTSSPTSSPANNQNNFPQFLNTFQSANNFQGHTNSLRHLQTTPSTFINEQGQGVAFQNPSSVQSATPSLPQPSSSASPALGSVGQTFSNKISNTGTLNRDGFTPINNNANNFHVTQFTITTSAPSLPSITRTELDKHNQQPSVPGKWDLGFDANEILTPPREDSFGRVGEYDTINVNKFRRPSTNLNPPNPNNEAPSSNSNHSPPNQFFNQFSPPQNNVHQFNQFSGSTSGSHNELFTPISSNPFSTQNNHFNPNKENAVEPQNNNVVWGSQKQTVSYQPTTSAPFLPTVPPNTQNSQSLSNFQSLNSLNSQPSTPHNFHNNAFNSPPQQLQFTQPPPPPPREQLFEFNQNFGADLPSTSQFDSFLPQGTVAEHTYQSYSENGRHFVKKRQWNHLDEIEKGEKYDRHSPNYNQRLLGQTIKVSGENGRHILKKRQWNGEDEVNKEKDDAKIHLNKTDDLNLRDSGKVSQHVLKKRQLNGARHVQLDLSRQLEQIFESNGEKNRHAIKKRQRNDDDEFDENADEDIRETRKRRNKKSHQNSQTQRKSTKRGKENDLKKRHSNGDEAKTEEHEVEKRLWNGEDEAADVEEDREPPSYFNARPVYSYVKTDRDGHFKWSVRHPSKR